MSINTLYHAEYHGDFTATGSSILGYQTRQYLRAPEITDPDVFQATSGNIVIPDTATVQKAFLVWASSNYNVYPTTSSLYLRTPASKSDKLVDATQIITDQFEYLTVGAAYYYGFSYEVTDLVKEGGSGDYWVYNFDIEPKPWLPDKAGWSLYIFYKDETLSYKNLSFYAGLEGVGPLFNRPTVTITLDGIRTPPSGPVLGRIGATEIYTTVGEPDTFYVNTTPMSDQYTPVDDFGNSISTIDNALMITWPPQSIAPNQSTREFQTKVIALQGTEVPNNATSVDVSIEIQGLLPQASDQIVSIATAFELYDVALDIEKSVDNATPYIGDTLTYTVTITNATDYATGTQAVLRDTLPSTLTYVPGSMRVVSNNYNGYVGSLTDPIDTDVGNASGNSITIYLGPDATPSAGGTLQAGQAVTLQYQAVVNNTASAGDLIENAAVASVYSTDIGETFESDAGVTVTVTDRLAPVKTASQYSYRPNVTSNIDFQVTYYTRNVLNNSSTIVIEDQIDSVLEIQNYYLDLQPSAGISIVDNSSGNLIQYTITTTGTETFPASFNLYVETLYRADTIGDEGYTIANSSSIQIGDDDLRQSNTVLITSISKREQSITDFIESIALEQTALSHILNAEGEKIQKALTLNLTMEEMLAMNDSVKKMVNSITFLETVLFNKLRDTTKE